MFKEIAGMASMLKQAKKISERMEGVSRELQAVRVVGSVGGGLVKVEMDGLGECLSVTIDPQLVAAGDLEMIEDLLPAAINDAMSKAKDHHTKAMKALSADLPIPGLKASISKIMDEVNGASSENALNDDDDELSDDEFFAAFKRNTDDDNENASKKKRQKRG